MKVELQCGDTITIPDGCKAVVKDGSVVFEREQEFKDGDILALADYVDTTCPFIYKNTDGRGLHSYYVGLDAYNQLTISKTTSSRWGNARLRLATEEEKQLLFDKMKEQGLRWNAEEKKVEKARWRAKRGEHYFLFRSTTLKVDCYTECFDEIDANLYHSDNYFRTNEQAEEAARRVKETLRKYHEEIGE